METMMEDDGYNLNPEISKVRHGKFIGIYKVIWVGIGWSMHYREILTIIS